MVKVFFPADTPCVNASAGEKALNLVSPAEQAEAPLCAEACATFVLPVHTEGGVRISAKKWGRMWHIASIGVVPLYFVLLFFSRLPALNYEHVTTSSREIPYSDCLTKCGDVLEKRLLEIRVSPQLLHESFH